MRHTRRNATILAVIRRALIVGAVLTVALALVPQALSGIAEIRDARGHLVANGGAGPFGSLNDAGWTLRYDSASRSVRGVGLQGVSIAGGLVYAERIFVPAHGLRGARVRGLAVNWHPVTARPNTLVPLGRASYLVVLQEAVVPGEGSGVVGLRIVAGDASLGPEPGTQLLIGLARAAQPVAKHRQARLSWLALGVPGRGPPDQLEPGDLVVFEPSARGPQHEGMYIGGGQFIQAPHTGDVVKISSLLEPAYQFGFVGAVRPWTP